MRQGKILAIDFGTKNIGIASCDELRIAVQPAASIPNLGRRDLLSRLKRLADDNDIVQVVVGMPLNMNGSSGEAAERVSRFIEYLKEKLRLEIVSVDERLSSVEAHEKWRKMSPRQQRRYRSADSLAAALVLERFLNEQ